LTLTAVRDIQSIETLIELLRSRVGNPVSANSLARDLQKSPTTIQSWLKLLENLVACALLKEIQRQQDVEGEEFDLHYIRNKEGHEIDFLVKEPLRRVQVIGKLAQNKSFPGGERIEAAQAFSFGFTNEFAPAMKVGVNGLTI